MRSKNTMKYSEEEFRRVYFARYPTKCPYSHPLSPSFGELE
jgi:hypothetical protein